MWSFSYFLSPNQYRNYLLSLILVNLSSSFCFFWVFFSKWMEHLKTLQTGFFTILHSASIKFAQGFLRLFICYQNRLHCLFRCSRCLHWSDAQSRYYLPIKVASRVQHVLPGSGASRSDTWPPRAVVHRNKASPGYIQKAFSKGFFLELTMLLNYLCLSQSFLLGLRMSFSSKILERL